MEPMEPSILQLLEDEPIIIAVKDDKGLKRCLSCAKPVVFVLYG